MESTEIKELFIKYVKRECSKEEVQQIVTYLKDSKDSKDSFEVPTIEDVYELLDKYPDMDEVTASRVLKNIKDISKREQKKLAISIFKLTWFKYGVAASILLLVSLTVFLNKEEDTSQFAEPIIVNNQIKAGSDKATLTLEDGSTFVFRKNTSYQAQNAHSNGKEIIYKVKERNKIEVTYNYLTIPRGGQFKITLSDGTIVWLNSESQLKYPVAFNKGKTREVELVYGEAYFDVSPSVDHDGSKFIVSNQAQKIEVIGTEFNVRAYKDEIDLYTTLVEGKVAISTTERNETLEPNQQSKVNIIDNEMTLSVVDVNNIISWKYGVFDFEGKSLEEIMKVLSRWYDMEVKFENEILKQERFSGRIKKSYSIEDILTTIKNTNIIRNYEINNKKVVLK